MVLNESRTFCPVYQLKIVGRKSKQETRIFFNLDSRICVPRIGGFLQAYHSYDMDQSETMILTFKQRVCVVKTYMESSRFFFEVNQNLNQNNYSSVIYFRFDTF